MHPLICVGTYVQACMLFCLLMPPRTGCFVVMLSATG